jgi:hypothetical protein
VTIWRLFVLLVAMSAATGAFAQELPPNHPPIGPSGPPDELGILPDSILPASDLPAGTIEAKIVDDKESPLAGTPVRLGILKQSVAEGEQRSEQLATTDASGLVRFSGLAIGSEYSYRISVRKEPAEYTSDPFALSGDHGQRVILHVLPATHDVSRAMVGMRAIFVIEPRDDVFQFQAMFRVFNLGRVTWVPDDVTIELPRGWKAFNAAESPTDARFVAEGDRLRLRGTFGPGEADVSFSFQVPNDHDESVDFRLSLPPHTAEVRVIAEAARGMGLEVLGFDPAQPSGSGAGQRVLVTGKRVRPGEQQLSDVTIRLTGVPTPGPGRWIALLLAALAAAAGLGIALGPTKEPGARLPDADLAQAREVLLAELVALEKARQSDQVGPRTYESARQALIDALARMDADRPVPAATSSPRKPAAVRRSAART